MQTDTILLGPPKQAAGAWGAGQGPQLSQVMWEGAEGQILTPFSCLLISENSNELIKDLGSFHFICWGVGACLYFPVLQYVCEDGRYNARDHKWIMLQKKKVSFLEQTAA